MSHVVVPHTGEIIDDIEDLPTADLALLIDDTKQLELLQREFKAAVGAVLVYRLDRARSWTLREGAFEITAPSDAPVLDVDVDGLRAELRKLVVEDIVDPAAAMAAITAKTTYTHSVAGLKALLKSTALAERLKPYVREVPRANRPVTVKRHTTTISEAP